MKERNIYVISQSTAEKPKTKQEQEENNINGPYFPLGLQKFHCYLLQAIITTKMTKITIWPLDININLLNRFICVIMQLLH